MVEIHAHGSPYVLNTILQLLMDLGARLAEPGEFTRRAFLNGKIDLMQAEAVADIIASRSKKALNLAVNQIAGKMNVEIDTIKEHLSGILAEIEASIDFSDQNLEPVFLEAVQNRLRSVVVPRLEQLIERHQDYAWIRTGVKVALIGAPNAGKSTLLNTLLGRERAIVSAIPGTTRDFIEETLTIEGYGFVFTDTAGLGIEKKDVLEEAGMQRTKDVASKADTVVYLVDATVGVSTEDLEMMASVPPDNLILVGNKTDLCQTDGFDFDSELQERFPAVKISALTGEGVSNLKALMVNRLKSRLTMVEEDSLLPNIRHRAALKKALEAVMSAMDAITRNLPEDLVAIDLRDAIKALNEIVGHCAGMDVLDDIFSRFCIGK